MTLNHLLVEHLQANRETAFARQQLARQAVSEASSRGIRMSLINRIPQLLPHR